ILDRVVGYPLSNLLGKKVARGSSAGRVQSVALRLVVEREREIEAFKPEEYWKLTALLAPAGTLSLPRKPLSIVKSEARPAAGQPEAEPAEGDGKAKKKKGPEVPPGAYLAELAEFDGKKFEPKTQEDVVVGIARLLDTARYEVTKLE